MKFLWAVTILVVLFYNLNQAQGKPDNDKAVRDACLTKTGVSKSEYNAAKKANYANASPTVQCYIECTTNATGTIKNGVVQDAKVIQLLTPVAGGVNAATTIVNDCKSQMTGANNCAKAYSFRACAMSKLPARGKLSKS